MGHLKLGLEVKDRGSKRFQGKEGLLKGHVAEKGSWPLEALPS